MPLPCPSCSYPHCVAFPPLPSLFSHPKCLLHAVPPFSFLPSSSNMYSISLLLHDGGGRQCLVFSFSFSSLGQVGGWTVCSLVNPPSPCSRSLTSHPCLPVWLPPPPPALVSCALPHYYTVSSCHLPSCYPTIWDLHNCPMLVLGLVILFPFCTPYRRFVPFPAPPYLQPSPSPTARAPPIMPIAGTFPACMPAPCQLFFSGWVSFSSQQPSHWDRDMPMPVLRTGWLLLPRALPTYHPTKTRQEQTRFWTVGFGWTAFSTGTFCCCKMVGWDLNFTPRLPTRLPLFYLHLPFLHTWTDLTCCLLDSGTDRFLT